MSQVTNATEILLLAKAYAEMSRINELEFDGYDPKGGILKALDNAIKMYIETDNHA